MTIARIIKCVRAGTGVDGSYQIEIRQIAGATSRWPDKYPSYEAALIAAKQAGVEVLLGWCEGHIV